MDVLKIKQTKLDNHVNRYRATMDYDGREATTEFDFSLSQKEQEDLRWYLEDFLLKPHPPNDQRAKSIETFMQPTFRGGSFQN